VTERNPGSSGGVGGAADGDWFRRVLGHYPTGVSVVTGIADDGVAVGLAVGSFTSVSLNPPLVAFLPRTGSSSWPKIRDSRKFCVNILAADQEEVCRTFATRGGDKFAGLSWRAAASGSPILDATIAMDIGAARRLLGLPGAATDDGGLHARLHALAAQLAIEQRQLDAAAAFVPIRLEPRARESSHASYHLSPEAQALKAALVNAVLAFVEQLGLSLTVLYDELARRLGQPTPLPLPEPAPRLTKRELQIVVLIGQRYSNEQIADALYISMNTLKTHMRHIRQKLGNRGQILAWWERHQHEYSELR